MARNCFVCGAPGVIRTPGLLVRSQTLYPAELRAQRDNVLKLPYRHAKTLAIRQRLR